MEKNWLIRTKSNHILGPVSKEKVLELLQNGSLKANDEVCSGNGYWFYIREEEMVSRFLLGNEKQTFNPLSEAKDVITAKEHTEEPAEPVEGSADITLVGNIDLKALKEQPREAITQEEEDLPPTETPAEEASDTTDTTEESLSSGEQKKNAPKLRAAKKGKKKVAAPQKSHSYLKYLFFLVIFLLLLVTYYRKQVIRFLFEGEMTKISVISPVYAQTEISVSKKKVLLQDSVELNGVSFRPEVGLNGFRVISQIDLPSFECEHLKLDTYRLGFLLFPPDRFNEKFLIKIRQCAITDEGNQNLSNWLKSIDQKPSLTKKEQKNRNLLTEVLNSPYNLITDQSLKSKLTNILIVMPEDTLSEVLLKSWLFLMLGNITRSDNLLKEFISTAPYYNWKKTSVKQSFYHSLGIEFLDGILEKLAKHPSDRLVFNLFCEYILSFYSDTVLISKITKNYEALSKDLVGLEYVRRVAPPLVHHLRLKRMSESERLAALKNISVYSLEEQSLWHWPFFHIDPLITEAIYPVLDQWEKNDQLWFSYLLHTEKMIDVWSKKSGKTFIHGRRQFLRDHLKGKDFMMSLFKLIKLGDIDQSLVETVGQGLVL